ncbi:M13 family metallopeptidase [Lichenicoccus sp.]|uniref:M13 family metallopeptidase n=1 Tax=Lichenicoccus sp. TaxID=2781899 RepID=UPI003D0977C2
MKPGAVILRACVAALFLAAGVPVHATQTASKAFGPWGFDLSGRNTAIAPGNNFYGYADGTYVRNLVIPADHTSWGAFDMLAELSRQRVHTILVQVSAHPVFAPSSTQEKLGTFYAAFMDEAAVEKRGDAPLAGDLDAIRKISDRAGFARLLGTAQSNYQTSLFALSIEPDAKNPKIYSVVLGQGGTGLPDRDYYLQPAFADKKAAYQLYVGQMLGLIGWPDASKQAAAVVAFEDKIAHAQWSKAAQRDPVKTYNPTSLADLQKFAPDFNWNVYLQGAGIKTGMLVLQEKSAIIDETRIAAVTDMPTLRAWLAFHLVDNASSVLPRVFVTAAFDFHGKTLGGQPQNAPRWKRAVAATSDAMGMAIGKIYVARYFPPAARETMRHLTDALKAAFRVRLQNNSWMSPHTKALAVGKLDHFAVQIGYPNKWRDYSGLTVRLDDLYDDSERAIGFEWRYWLDHLGHPVNRNEWDMTPQTVNAYNNPPFDEVVFPAAILQPPFFNPAADPAINFGAIGGVIGHEMTHSFDDEGRKYDAQGRLQDWWTKQDAARFDARADRLGAQFDAMQPLPGAHINGKLTMGENIADLGGLTLALDAYHASLHGKPAPVLDGLTGDQRVFLGWAQVWRQKLRPDRQRELLVADPHSPPMARVNGPLRNIDGWYKAWNVRPGDALYLAPKDRVMIW